MNTTTEQALAGARAVARRTREGQDTQGSVLAFPTPGSVRRHDTPDGYLTTVEMVEATGISYRRLDYWARTGLLHSHGSPHPGTGTIRCHPPTEIPVMRLLDRLAADGLDVRAAHDLARELLTTGHTTLAGIRLDLPEEP